MVCLLFPLFTFASSNFVTDHMSERTWLPLGIILAQDFQCNRRKRRFWQTESAPFGMRSACVVITSIWLLIRHA